MICAVRNQIKIQENNYVDIIFTGCVLSSDKHLMIDLARQEKEQLIMRTDINLPPEIKDQLDEQGIRRGQD